MGDLKPEQRCWRVAADATQGRAGSCRGARVAVIEGGDQLRAWVRG
jgi:hypothetical protein